MKKLVLTMLVLTLTLAGCPPTETTEVSLSVSMLTLNIGQSFTLSVTSTDAEDAPFSWAVDNPAAVALSANSGTSVVVTALAAGTANVTVTGSKSGVSATAVVAVPVPLPEPEDPVTVSVTPVSAAVEAGQSVSLTASSSDPGDADFSWTVANASIASLDATTGVSVNATALSAGVTTISVTGVNSGVSATAVLSVLAADPEDPNTPLLPAGLKVEVVGVSIPADLKPEVIFTATNDRGDVIPQIELTTVQFLIAYLQNPAPTASSASFISYNTRMESPTGLPPALQATYDGNGLAGVSANIDGTYTYKFKSALPASYDTLTTHAVGGQFRRTSALDGKAYVTNAVYEFMPDGSTVVATRDIVETDACNSCHTRLSFHGDIRRDVKLCILCHNPNTTDANTGNNLDMRVMVHKIHMGEELPSSPYQIYGYRDTLYDYSEVVYPQDIRNCTSCHDQGEKAAQADYYLTKPTRLACGSCHDRTWFGDPKATPEGYENHPFNFAQNDDEGCSGCHTANDVGMAPILEAHRTVEQLPENPGLNLDITGISTNPDDGTLVLNIKASYGDGSPITDLANIARRRLIVAWPAQEYENSIADRDIKANVASSTSPTGEYVYTLPEKLPTTPGLSFGIVMAGRINFTSGDEEHEQGILSNNLNFFTLDDSEPAERRQVVDEAQCNQCHGEVRGHGGTYLGVDTCVMCHRANAGQIHFKSMLHKVHSGELELGGEVLEFAFPGLVQKCSICHGSHSVDVPLAAEALPTVIEEESAEGESTVITILPERSACISCHNDLLVDFHALANSDSAAGVETCAVCHGAGADYAVAAVHALAP